MGGLSGLGAGGRAVWTWIAARAGAGAAAGSVRRRRRRGCGVPADPAAPQGRPRHAQEGAKGAGRLRALLTACLTAIFRGARHGVQPVPVCPVPSDPALAGPAHAVS